MSQENAQRFMELAAADAQLKQALAEKGTLEAVLDRAVQLGAEKGLDFDAAELEAFLRAAQAAGEPLSDEQLDHVSGGWMSLALANQIMSNVSKTRSEISMTFARNARG
jgi:predicted ribosomally synthesized peptide with nif11-like leader